ncbi:MAG: PVC-type heme-binding CxxCH protein [Pirellula sp.]|jgi:putative membrane-bound dehydrogenase-like protein
MKMTPLYFSILRCLFLMGILGFAQQFCFADPPRSLIDGWKIESVRTEPDLVTPVGCCFDDRGRLFVIESHTHFPPDDYDRPKVDRIYLFSDSDHDGSLDEQSLFYEGGTATMGLVYEAGILYVVSRSKVSQIRDTNDDGKADESSDIVTLETTANYPHNGLSSIVIGPDKKLYIGQGENFGAPYRLIGKDSEQIGSGEGGNIFSCRLDGSELRRHATGLWNPFGLCFDAQGDLWTVDNDPDSRPPCRLIRVVESGDYGFQFRFGRAGTNPLIAWNGELPGTLGMEAGTGEAPCAVLPHQGRLLVTSWGENRLELFSANDTETLDRIDLKIAIQGDTMFRPVGLAAAPDGSFLMTDWVDRSYSVHSKGRLWKITPPPSVTSQESSTHETGTAALQKAPVRSPQWESKRKNQLRILAQSQRADLLNMSPPSDAAAYQQWLLACRWREWHELTKDSSNKKQLRIEAALRHAERDVRRLAVRLAAETEDRVFINALTENLNRSELDPFEFSETVAAISYLESLNDPSKEVSLRIARLAAAIESPLNSDALKAMAIRFLPTNSEKPESAILDSLIKKSTNKDVQIQSTLLLAMRRTDATTSTLLQAVKNTSIDEDVRALAMAGLNARKSSLASELPALGSSIQGAPKVYAEWARVMNTTAITPNLPAPENFEEWWALVGSGGDPQAGQRVFLRSVCSTCHAYAGRGASLAPDLSTLAGTSSRKKILESILYPAKEVGPLYLPWKILTTDGRSLVGVKLNAGGSGNNLRYLGADGTTFELKLEDIEIQEPSSTSIMPDDAYKSLTLEELRDLLALLE